MSRKKPGGHLPLSYLLTRQWTISFGGVSSHNLGECDFDNQVIRIRKDLTPTETLGILIHEVLHAELPDLKEESIERIELRLMRAIQLCNLDPKEEE